MNKNILELLRKNPEGLTIKDISTKLKRNRITTRTYLGFLLGSGLIRERRVGVAKLYYLVKG